jgi:hypothetical protein
MTFKRRLLPFLWLFLPAAVFGQTAERLDAVLAAERVSFAQAAAVLLPAAGLADPEAGEEEILALARQWFPRGAAAENPVSLDRLSYMAMKSFGLSGGFMYALFPGPRYAYRAMAWRRLLPPRADPRRTLSGEELLYITGRLLALGGGEPSFTEEDGKVEVKPGQGLSSGSEGVMPYEGEFEVE